MDDLVSTSWLASQLGQTDLTAPTVDAATARFGEFAEHWRDRYPAMVAT